MADSLGGVVSSFLGNIYAEVDVDFPADRLARKVGSFLPCALAGFLVAIQVLDPTRCFLPAADIISASSPYAGAKDAGDIPDEFQGHLSAYVDTYCRTTSNYETAQGENDLFRRYVIFALLVQAVLAYLPYIAYFASCQSIVQPLVNDAKEIAKIAEKSPEALGDFDFAGAKDKTEMPVFPDDPDVRKLEHQVQLRLQCILNIFVKQRMPAMLKQSLHCNYWWMNVFGRILAFFLQAALLLTIIFNYSFPATVRCNISGAFDFPDLNATSIRCVMPANPYAKHFIILDLIFVGILPLVSILPYYFYMRNGISNDVREAAAIFVDEGLMEPFEEFASELLAHRDDDIVFILGLLYANIDKYIAHQILITYQRMPKGDKETFGIVESEGKETDGCCVTVRRRT